MQQAERDFWLDTIASACIYSVFSLIGYWIVGPIGIIAQISLFQRRLFQDLDALLFQMEHL